MELQHQREISVAPNVVGLEVVLGRVAWHADHAALTSDLRDVALGLARLEYILALMDESRIRAHRRFPA